MANTKEILAGIRDSFRQGVGYYSSGNFREAEQEFVKALKPLLAKPLMKAIHPENIQFVKTELLGAMYHLGEIYLQDNHYLDHHSKAAAIFQYCAGFAEKYGATIEIGDQIVDSQYFLHKAYDVEREFLVQVPVIEPALGVGDIAADESYYENYQQRIDHYRSDLANIRTAAKGMLDDISDLGVEQIAERSSSVEEIYQISSQFFVDHHQEPMGLAATLPDTPSEGKSGNGLLQRLLRECYEQLGPVPKECQHSIIALGSLSLGTMTPWSDLEFAILVNKDREDYKEYFRNLTKLLHIKTINLGETPLQSVGIESLNNFRTANEGDDWFLDDITTKGFGFDSVIWRACKNPLGRQGGYKVERKVKNDQGVEEVTLEDKPDYELILTPEEMAAIQFAEVDGVQTGPSFASDRYLVQALRSSALIDGSQELLDDYRARLHTEDPEQVQILRTQSMEILREDVDKFSLKLGDEEEGKLIDVKNGIYRLGDRVVNELASFYGIAAEAEQPMLTVWQKIEEMQARGVISIEGANHLKEAISIATELRLRTYSHNDGQSEGLSTYLPAERHQLLEKTFYVKDIKLLHHFYYVMIPIQYTLQAFCAENIWEKVMGVMFLKIDNMYDCSNHTKGLVYARFLDYDSAIKYMELARLDTPKDLVILKDLWHLYNVTQVADRAIIVGKEILVLRENHRDMNHLEIANSCNDLGDAFCSNGEYNIAIDFHTRALSIRLEMYSLTLNHPDIAMSYINLGRVYGQKNEYDTAIDFYQKALRIYKVVHALNPNHPDIAVSYNNLGVVYHQKGDFEKAMECHGQALCIYESVYVLNLNHPGIGKSYGNLGAVYGVIGDFDKAIECYKKSLKIYRAAYLHDLNHPDIGKSYNNLGDVYFKNIKYDEALWCYERALKIMLIVHASTPVHPDIANIYNNLGSVYLRLVDAGDSRADYGTAIEFYQKALDIFLSLYSATDHHDVVRIQRNLDRARLEKDLYDTPMRREMLDDECSVEDESCGNWVKLGNQELLSERPEDAKEYYAQIDPSYRQINFESMHFVQLQFKGFNIAYRNGDLVAAINSQQVLLEIDPELHDNYYYHLAYLYAAQGNIEEANIAFIQSLEYREGRSKIKYLQFLILNRDHELLSSAIESISDLLYDIISSDGEDLIYGVIEQNSVCRVLSDIIKQRNASVKINSKVLAYYLLITNSEYIREEDNIELVLNDFFAEAVDEISFLLFTDAEALVTRVTEVEGTAQIAEDEHIDGLGSVMDDSVAALLSGQAADEIDHSL
jgi:tetratricopeptide (TPR) repeat protein